MTSQESSTPVLALLGVTGNTGQVILRTLLAKKQCNLRIYARSQGKLLSMFPGLASNPQVQLYIGSITDTTLMRNLLSGVRIIISTLGSDGLAPTSVQQVSARSIIAALKDLKEGAESWERPRLIWLSSSSKNECFAAARPAFVHSLILSAFHLGYVDLQGAQDIILADQSLTSVLLIQPGVLIDEEGTGFEISTESVRLATSYQDLGEAFVELALNESYASLHQVGVSSCLGDRAVRYAPIMLFRIVRGLVAVYMPFGVRVNQMVELVLSGLKIISLG